MDITEFLAADDVACAAVAASKSDLLAALSRRAAAALGIEARLVFDALMQRERLGSTGLGKGIALPHARLAGLPRPYGAFVQLAVPMPFEAVDERPVDLVFLLLFPLPSRAADLRMLSGVARLLHQDGCARALRACRDAGEMYEMLKAAAAPA